MRKAFLIFSHELTKEQNAELIRKWKVESFIPLPHELKKFWSNIPPELKEIKPYLIPIIHWLERKAKSQDIVLIQGDPGAVYIMVNKAFEIGLIPIYATTKRVVKEHISADGTVQQIRIFLHNRFRVYEK